MIKVKMDNGQCKNQHVNQPERYGQPNDCFKILKEKQPHFAHTHTHCYQVHQTLAVIKIPF